MKLHQTTTKFNCGIDLHAQNMYACIMDQTGKKVLHQNIKGKDFKYFLKIVGVNVKNMRNRAVKGSVKMGSIVKTFELKAEESKLVTFDSYRSISTEPELFTAEVKVDGAASILTVKKELQAMFAEHAANELKIDGDLSDWPAGKLTILNYENAV